MTNQVIQTNDIKPSLLVAIEMSLKKWVLALAIAGQPKKRIKTVEAGNYLELMAVVAEAKTYFKLPEETAVTFCYEAGRDGFYPYRQLTATGHTVWVIDSASIEVSRRQRQAKTDGVDVVKLLELMQRKARGEEKALRIVRVPDIEVEDQRQISRERKALQKKIQAIYSRIRDLLFAQGYREIPSSVGPLKKWLERRQGLGSCLRERIEREIEELVLLEAQLHRVEKLMQAAFQQESQTPIVHAAYVLSQLCGIGFVSGWVLSSELFGWRKFRNRREVGGVLGLTPTPYSSGGYEREQGISKAGNSRARALLVELSWLWLRYQPDSALSVWFRQRFASGGKRMRRIGIVAMARRLAIELWRYVDYGVIPEGARLKVATQQAAAATQ